MNKKHFFIALLAFISINVCSAEIIDSGTCGANGNNLTWTLTDDGTLTISGTGYMDNWDYYYNNNAPWYRIRETIKEIIIYDGITSIGRYAFTDCSNLVSVTIPNSVTRIGTEAFVACSNLVSVTIPNSVTRIQYDVFYGCSSLPVIDNLRYADTYLVEAVDKTLSTYNIKEGTKWIGTSAFSDCSNLTSITIPNSVTHIDDYAFSDCSSLPVIDNLRYADTYLVEAIDNTLSTYTIKEGTKWIGNDAFYGCSNLTSITIPNSVISINTYAFEWCSSLTSITIPNSVTNIDWAAFSGCSGLTSVTIGNSVTSIGNRAFSGCSSLKEINLHTIVPPILDDYGFDEGILTDTDVNVYVKCGLESLYAEQQWGGFSSFIGSLPYSIEVESSDTNMGNVSITKQPESCENLASVQAVPRDGYYFLCWSDGTTENPYTLSLTQDTLLKAEFYAIGTGSGRCGDNLYWTLADGNLFITGSGVMYDYTEETQPWYKMKDYIRSVSFPADITTIGNYAFYGCKNITSINIPQNVTTIGDYSFAECSLLSSVTIGAGVTSIGCYAFLNDWSIEEIYCYPYNAPTVCETAFSGIIKNFVYLYVQGDRVHHYQLNPYFTDFDIRAIGAETVPSDDDVVVVPSDRDAQFTWPANGNASSYTLQITKDGMVFCTLVFNEYGQLTGIAFAPARNGEQHPRQAATATTNGWQFTVTGLNEGSAYAYTLDVKDVANKVLNSYNGTFRTLGTGTSSSIDTPDEIGSGLTAHARKVIENGNVYILLPDGRKLNMQGAEVK